MTARDDAVASLVNAGYGQQTAREIIAALVAEEGAQRDRRWAQRIREVGAAKGWSAWAAAFIDPDTEFVDTGMPATETIVAELRRLDRLAVLHEVDEQLAAMTLPEHLKGTLNASSYADAWQACRARVRALATGSPEKDTGGGRQPRAGESTPGLYSIVLAAIGSARGPALPLPAHTQRLLAERVTDAVAPLVPTRPTAHGSLPPGGHVGSPGGKTAEPEPAPEHAFFQPGRSYTDGYWLYRCDAVSTNPDTGEKTALGWLHLPRSRTRSHLMPMTAEDWAAGWTDSASGGM